MRVLLVGLVLFTTAVLGDSASVINALPPDPSTINTNVGFGLIGDGVADDTAAFSAAINATYSEGSPDCSQPGARIVFLEGNGKMYRLSGTVVLPMWVRLIGWGVSVRPVLILAPNTVGFNNSSALASMVKVINWAPPAICNKSSATGGNMAFGTGVINVDVAIGSGNPGAVGISNGVAQGGVLRAMTFTLASDAAASVFSPGWSHQELTFIGGRYGVLIEHTGAWPSIFRDCSWTTQSVAAVGWSANVTWWEGLTLLRTRIESSPAAFDLTGAKAARVTVLDSYFANISVALLLPPPFALGNSSVLLRDSSGDGGVPILMAASDVAPAVPNPGGVGAFTITRLLAGAASPDARAQGGANVSVGVWVDAAAAQAPVPPLPQPDTPVWLPVGDWTCVTDHGLKGDGSTDNTAALQALLSSPPTPALYFPVGVYVFSDTVNLSASISSGGLQLFGLHCWDTVLTLKDNSIGFMDPAILKPLFHVHPSSTAPVWVTGLNIRTGFSFGSPQPAPVPAGWTNPNPGTIAVLWEAATGGGLQDVFFHPDSWPDNTRLGTGPNTELSLVVQNGGGGVFADIWSCNAYSRGGARVLNTASPVVFQQLSSEHHAGHELWLTNATDVTVHCMQTEDRSPDAAPTASVVAELGSLADITGLFSYYAAQVPSSGAVLVDASSAVNVSVFRQYHSYHPMFYNCSLLAQAGWNNTPVCIIATDFSWVFSGLAN